MCSVSSRSSIYHSVEGPLTYLLNGELITEPRPLPPPPILPPLPPQPLATHTSQASFVSALAMEEESSVEAEKTAEPGPVTRQPHVMACYQNYLAHYQVDALVLHLYRAVLFTRPEMLTYFNILTSFLAGFQLVSQTANQ